MPPIEAKVPYRIPLVGGSSDLPRYYRKYGGQSICCTIDKFISVSITENKHAGVNIQSKADLPWRIGLGSSGAYYSALVLALSRFKNQGLPPLAIAKLAYDLETGIAKNATGRQDSIACMFTGVSKITYFQNDSVKVDPIPMPTRWREKLNERLLLFDTGVRRTAGDSLNDLLLRKNNSLLHKIAELPKMLLSAWAAKDLHFLGAALDRQEYYRRRLSPLCRSPRTDKLLSIARNCGAGARLAGAGLGCLVCYCAEEKQKELRERLALPEFKFSILW
jgi:D-glycero-alpha-D-manno-heptose-7-phosphate kinase